MKKLIFCLMLVLAGCDSQSPKIMSYEELKNYPVSCKKQKEQLAELEYVQSYKNFAQDPDLLNDTDRAYNSRLKATIWWYAMECHNEKTVSIVDSNS